jgi:hypothetical protein
VGWGTPAAPAAPTRPAPHGQTPPARRPPCPPPPLPPQGVLTGSPALPPVLTAIDGASGVLGAANTLGVDGVSSLLTTAVNLIGGVLPALG